MTTLTEQNLTFTFQTSWTTTKYDDWQFYRQKSGFQGTLPGVKAVDFLAIEPPNHVTWLIEVKDFRQHPRRKSTELIEEVTQKVVASLAGLVAASHRATDRNEKRIASLALQSLQLKVVFHIEQPAHPHRHNQTQYDLSRMQQKLRKRLQAIDPTAKIMERSSQNKPWQVT